MMSLQTPEIVQVVSQRMQNSMVDSLYKDLSQKIQYEEFEKLRGLYVKAGKNPDSVMTELVNDVVGRIIDLIPQKFAQITFEKISLKAQNQPAFAKFDIAFEMEPIKPYVEFVAKSYGQHLFSWRVRFEVNSNVKLSQTEIKINDKGRREIILGSLEAEIGISLVGLPFISMEQPKEILLKKIELDLSEYSFTF